MFNRKRLDRERLEIYLVHLLLAYRPMFLICGLILMVFSAAILIQFLLLGSVVFVVAALLLLLGISYPAVLFTARLGSWTALLFKNEDQDDLNGH